MWCEVIRQNGIVVWSYGDIKALLNCDVFGKSDGEFCKGKEWRDDEPKTSTLNLMK